MPTPLRQLHSLVLSTSRKQFASYRSLLPTLLRHHCDYRETCLAQQSSGSGGGRSDLPLESFWIREEDRARALAHLVGKDLFVACDDACDNRLRGVRRRRFLERQHLGHLGVDRTWIHAKHLRVLPAQHRARDLRERVRRGLRGAVGCENREVDER